MKQSDALLDRWERSQPEEVRAAAIQQFVADDTQVDLSAAGLEPMEAQALVNAYSLHVERNVLKPAGLSFDVWDSYISDEDRPAFRQACVRGEWHRLYDHAQRIAAHIAEHGDVNAAS